MPLSEPQLTTAIEAALAELGRETKRKADLEASILQTKRSIMVLESKGQRVVALLEYKRMRLDVVQGHKALAVLELKLRDLNRRYQGLCRERQATQQ